MCAAAVTHTIAGNAGLLLSPAASWGRRPEAAWSLDMAAVGVDVFSMGHDTTRVTSVCGCSVSLHSSCSVQSAETRVSIYRISPCRRAIDELEAGGGR